MKDDTERPTLKAIVALLSMLGLFQKYSASFPRFSNWDPDERNFCIRYYNSLRLYN